MLIAICDDDVTQLNMLSDAVLACPHFAIQTPTISKFTSGRELLESVKNGQCYDFLFLDIQMPKLDGLEIYKRLADSSSAPVIFVSTHIEKLPQVFRLNRPIFLMKPYSQTTFDDTVKVAVDRLRRAIHYKYTLEGRTYAINIDKIIYFSVFNHTLTMHTVMENIDIPRTRLDNVEREFREHGFFRCHRSYLINLRYYSDRTQSEISMIGATEAIPLPRDRIKPLEEAHLLYQTGGPDAF